MSFDKEPPTVRPGRPRTESLIPPRAVPSLTAGGALTAATIAAGTIPEPIWRVVALGACTLLAWFVGYFTPPPRRRFRRTDTWSGE